MQGSDMVNLDSLHIKASRPNKNGQKVWLYRFWKGALAMAYEGGGLLEEGKFDVCANARYDI
jgi:hypothetical protein